MAVDRSKRLDPARWPLRSWYSIEVVKSSRPWGSKARRQGSTQFDTGR
jgi:hypothetical protein